MSEDIDLLEDMEDLLRSAQRAINRSKNLRTARLNAQSAEDIAKDYVERLAEKATFRRLLSDEALDGVRFRWLFKVMFKTAHPVSVLHEGKVFEPDSIDSLRAFIDKCVAKEESSSGPSA